MFTVVSAAETTDLTLLATVKADLNIATADKSKDAYIGRLIKRASAAICAYMNVPAAPDGSRTIGRETLSETFRFRKWGHRNSLVLAKKPVIGVTSIHRGDELYDSELYELDGAAGMVTRICPPSGFTSSSGWSTSRDLIAVYETGYTLPGDDSEYTLPPDIEGCAVELVKMALSSRTRDPLVKAIEVTDIDRKEFWVGGIGGSGTGGASSPLPPSIAATLDPYCYEPSVG